MPVRAQSAGLRAAPAAAGQGSHVPAAPIAAGSYSPAKQGGLAAVGSGPALPKGDGSTGTSTAGSGSWQPLRSPTKASSGSANSSVSAAAGRRSRPASGRTPKAGDSSAEGPAAAQPAAAGSLAGLDPEQQQQFEAIQAQLGSGEWKRRLEAVEGLQASAAAHVAALPPGAQLWLADALAQRVGDVNLRVQQQVRRGAVAGFREERASGAMPCSVTLCRWRADLERLPCLAWPVTHAGPHPAQLGAGRRRQRAGPLRSLVGGGGVQVPGQRQPQRAPGEVLKRAGQRSGGAGRKVLLPGGTSAWSHSPPPLP